MDPHSPDQPEQRVAYGYLAPSSCGRHGSAIAAGGASIAVSASALRAIRAAIPGHGGWLPRAAAVVLTRIDEREAHATELGLLVRALARREVFVRVAAPHQ
jgi:hypothetical protein